METMCVYFGDEWGNEEDHLWHNDGCKPGPLSNTTHMHCRCDHLTKFTGLVAPNPINFAEVFTKDILQNPIGLILVLVIFLLYLLAVLWARKADRRDLTKVGVAPPQGHTLNPDPWCQYVVTLYTGFKGGAGTTASVWINLFGDYGRTGPIALQDENRPLFEEGSVDSFLVSSQNIIGMIHVVHIWHDNTGYSPEWYLSQIVVQEKGTNRIVYFLCNSWFAVGEGDGKIERLIPVASPEEMTEFVNLFRSKTSRDVNDSHLWFSVKGRPARSPFTRVQRLSCCLTLLYSTMVTNIMFFGQGDNFDPPDKIQIAGIEMNPPIDLPKLMISLQSAAIIMPVNILIVFFFRHSRRKPSKKRKNNHCSTSAAEEGATMSEKHQSWMLAAAEPVDKKKTFNNQKTFFSTSPSTQASAQEPILMYSLGLERTFNLNSKSLLANKSPSKKSKEKTSKKYEDNKSFKSRDSQKEQHKEEEGGVRWWAICTGWLLVWSASFVAAFFTVLYTLSFGRPKAEAWCIAFVTSFLSDIIVIQPVKLVVVAVVFALFIKSPVTEEDPAPSPLHKTEEYLPTKRDRMPVVTLPPGKAELSEARLKKLEDKKRRSAIIEVWLFVIFVLVVTMIAYNEKDPMAFHMNESVRNSLLHETEELTFEEVADVESFWTWLQAGLLPTLYQDSWYNGMVNPARVIMGNGKSWLVGTAAMRQVRLEPGLPCNVPERMQTYGTRCVLSFSLTDMDAANYSTGWQNSSISTDTRWEMLKPWVYTFASLTDGFPTFGEHGTYTGGGYSTSLDPSVRFSNLTQEQLLQDGGWLDQNTRAVMVETTLYNPDANLFSVVTFLVEFTYYGNAFPSASISTLRLFQTSQILLIALKGVMVLFLFIFVYREGKQLVASPFEYLQDVWNWVELLVILAGFSTLAVYFQTQSVIDQVSEPGSHTQFSVYRRAAGWVEVYTYVTAALICCVTLKLVRLIRFNKVVQVLFGTISTSFKPLTGFMMVVAIILMAYTQMGSLLFGANLQTYSSIGSSLASICLMTIGSFDTAELTEVSWIYGPIFFFLFQVTMQFFLMTMFMAILMDTYADANVNTEVQKLRMMAFVRQRVKKQARETSQDTRRHRDRSNSYQITSSTTMLFGTHPCGDKGIDQPAFLQSSGTLSFSW
ncbi:PREDICTED: polycystic kidney disease protein 1-like 2 [Branchiostoma belcheri]|uniref:Polycystic kidney disease protein 1-like 2 n=1 Tax=Branchiostoma belcheri TaxID=7741 RepID=A0A6P5AD49_BRABE|nr:PREDICTED: polycystic kidney disease protein 1-like 2 [Branchiostoma belcheri]